MLALFFGTFVSEDLACIAAGSLAASGLVDPFAAVLACFAGIVAGDLALFAAGRFFGDRILASRFGSRFVKKQSLQRAEDWIKKRGAGAIFISRFLSGLRLPTFFLSGVFRFDARRFVFVVTLAAALWTPAVVAVAAVWQMAIPFGAIFGAVGAFVSIKLALRLTDRKRRRVLSGRIKRLWQWEFWPLWLFYAPVVVYVLFLAIRFRGFSFTAANPGMPAGGFVGESKDEIYELISRSAAASPHLLKHVKLDEAAAAEAKLASAREFMASNNLAFPIVVKPDAGERGNGVKVICGEVELKEMLSGADRDLLIQEFFDGVEASVFYYCHPDSNRGSIFSITEKQFPAVVGDGASTLEELILRDERAHIIAGKYLERNADRLSMVPAIGESVRLVEIGSHSKGAIFREGEWLRSAKLEERIDEISRGIPGFCFGRFDVRAESFGELRKGRFRIIELNGVTSESTNLYDPQYNLLQAYRVLFRQWRTAFEIGAENRGRGTKATPVWRLAGLVLGARSSGVANVQRRGAVVAP